MALASKSKQRPSWRFEVDATLAGALAPLPSLPQATSLVPKAAIAAIRIAEF
jgi:hypothetical protein